MNKKSFKRLGEMQDGVKTSVRFFLNMAKAAHADVLRYKKLHDNGSPWAYDYWLRCRSVRSNWILAAKFVLIQTTNGVAHFKTSERQSKIWSEQRAAKQAAEVAA